MAGFMSDIIPVNHPLLRDLNPQQREAVTTTDGPVLVIAGAGSGKTRVVTHRIAWLISEKKVAPWEIFAATFTNKAAREMKNRVAHLCGATDTIRLAIGTFHSLCARILRKEAPAAGLTMRYSICDETDQSALVRDILRGLGHDPKLISPSDTLEAISLAKMRLLEGDDAANFIESIRSPEQAEVYRLYQKRLREGDAVDFDDLILLVVRIWQDHPEILRSYQERYRYALVDEYQDTNFSQFELMRLLTEAHRNICVVGDEDQSIYSWRGAEIKNLLDFQEVFSGAVIIRLEQNYRSTGNILDAADALIVRNTQRLGKTLWTESEKGDPLVVIDAMSDHDEAEMIAYEIRRLGQGGLPFEKISLFYRINALSRIYEEALRTENIPYHVVGGVRFYDRAEIKDILAYLQVIDNPSNTLALMRIINRPKRGLGPTAISKILAHADKERMPFFQVLTSPEQLTAAGLKGKTAESASKLGKSLIDWTRAAAALPLRQLAKRILDETQYEASLGNPRSIEVISRLENIREFVGSLSEFQEQQPRSTLRDYLENIVLRSVEKEETQGGVSLMTMHNAKGLEFDVVFVPALEDDIFPNARAVREQGNLEEERRLFYVAITRARKRVYLSYCHTRRLYGQPTWPTPSVFLFEIPAHLRVNYEDAELGPIHHKKKVQAEEEEKRNAPDGVASPPSPAFLARVAW